MQELKYSEAVPTLYNISAQTNSGLKTIKEIAQYVYHGDDLLSDARFDLDYGEESILSRLKNMSRRYALKYKTNIFGKRTCIPIVYNRLFSAKVNRYQFSRIKKLKTQYSNISKVLPF